MSKPTRASSRIKTLAETGHPPPRVTRAASKATSRKPLTSRGNSPTQDSTKAATPPPSKGESNISDLDSKEPIRAFLRIRPHLNDQDPSSAPYLEQLSDTTVRFSDPSSSNSQHSRLSSINAPSIYTFSHVFPPNTSQSHFFSTTTLPLVSDLLNGQDSLLFTYGVTNSGKTYTIQGTSQPDAAGILPRTLDVIFNSIKGLKGDDRFRPVRLQGIEFNDSPPPKAQTTRGKKVPALADVLEEDGGDNQDIDPTTLKLDRNYQYTVWLSYAEVYNEKVYDLFETIDDPSTPSQSKSSTIPRRPTSAFLNTPLPSSQSHPLLLVRKALQVKPCPLSDNPSSDNSISGKYVAGLRQLHVQSASQAKELLRLGQLHRRVFGTLANSQSSRSHALVTIKVLRVHKGEKNDPTSIQTSRLTLVDLAGSERTKHTQTSGERLREAGNINKSLMVLGQCMETMRSNQRALARSLASRVGTGSRLDTRDVKKGLAVVPFRHSKLTEILMDYFVGEGRAVMIVNVNPYDTGYDENSHVMKFAALAREVLTTAPTAIRRPIPMNKTRASITHTRKVTLSMGGSGRKVSEAHLEVLEEDEESNEDDDDNEPINPLVDALFDEVESLRVQLFEAQMRSAIIEVETREEVMQEMEDRMRNMEKMYTQRLMKEVERNEMKMDAKIDMMHRASSLGKQKQRTVPSAFDSDFEEEEKIDDSLIKRDDEAANTGTQYTQDWSSDISSRSPSPLASKGENKNWAPT
ncbi:Kinesin-like protein [Abortiporus biennis]